MSGPSALSHEDPALDAGVLHAAPVLEFHGWAAAARHGGVAITPWRAIAAAARAAGVPTAPVPPVGPWPQALVRLTKGRAAVDADMATAWHHLARGGHLVLTGANDLGIASAIRRFESQLGPATRLAQRARQHVVAWMRHDRDLPLPVTPPVPLGDGSALTVSTAPGVFSHDGLDEGTATLLAALAELPPATHLADLGCGAGHLALAALRRWPGATAWLGDADYRAVGVASANAQALGLGHRATVAWWDASEPLPVHGLDLVLTNPPAHAGTANSLDAALAMFRAGRAALAPGGRLVVVANRQLPYERPLAHLGPVTTMPSGPRFKVLLCHG